MLKFDNYFFVYSYFPLCWKLSYKYLQPDTLIWKKGKCLPFNEGLNENFTLLKVVQLELIFSQMLENTKEIQKLRLTKKVYSS